ncbi:peptidase M75, Imelysin [Mesorhizobium sp. M1C.F.Ca.ET.193.01.1.1]|uniref:imelysin family protein n=1 Tax=unclassified Mesorhizobium TaxID=325217 RepID=UPI000FD1A3F5|nr:MULTISPECIES: imelysin family protein [unclassified Mesorhizobium]TGT04164.1 peptidase M75, Imelysin [bacterium M00.F.Ca.ET.177.01.1.1]TGQ56755.1 peptidase M75, Imelysin [Mesorhizobium sp. M1C.F.Ca.ET.210.01.1.1]TGQ75522.1 peptidase M75, Imelysin [Mesorhizobium sp. M1C.F.Ca.ET.212.01.1.1]TGR13931.1 peptidase M75, Imelysin [Mesorhizobium sp. M1C.F.Ca.ET.204.01.1.1]TGR34186.1 peptidase M75, Imelysin [Mesorhizobium sp. M1C.F.Ca.ET.196.01.1.1]
MSRRIVAVLAFPLFLAAAWPASAAVRTSDVIGRAIDGFVGPAYASLDDRATSLTKAMRQLCATPSEQNLDAARADYSATVEAWSVAEIIAFGPIKENNRLERMLYWPDRKSIGLRQVQATLAAKDPSATDPAQLAAKSVAMQGLGALEYVLFGDGAETLAGTDEPYRCAYGAAVAGNIETIASEVRDAWNKPDGFAALWANPGSKNPLYRNGTEAVTELVGVFINELDMIRDVRLKGFLGAKPEADKPKQAIYWRSQNTTNSLAGNLSGIDRLFKASKLGDALPADARWMAESIHIQLTNGVATAKSITGPIDKALADPALRGKLDHFALITSSLSTLIGTRMTAEFGLTAGFSSLDGD